MAISDVRMNSTPIFSKDFFRAFHVHLIEMTIGLSRVMSVIFSKINERSVCTVGKIYTPIFSFFRKRVVNIAILELGPVSDERSDNSSFYKGIHEFLRTDR